MAIQATAVWEVRTTGSDSNGGGFDPTAGVPGTDYSQQDAAQIAYTDLVIDGAVNTNATSAGNPFTSAHVGNVINVTGGTGFTVQRVQVISVAAGVATMDKSLGTLGSTGGTGNLGGALKSIGISSSVAVAQNLVYLKAGTHSITSASNNVANGCTAFLSGVKIVGYSTNRTVSNTDTQPVLQINVSTATIVSSNTNKTFYNVEFDGNSQTASTLEINGTANFVRCTIRNFASATSGRSFINCVGTGNAGRCMNGIALFCEMYANTATPFTGTLAIGCLSYANTGGSTDGFTASGAAEFIGNIAYNNGRHGFSNTSNATASAHYVNNHAEGNASNGYSITTAGILKLLIKNGGYNNASGDYSAATFQQIDPITLSASAFVDAASANFALNKLSTGGALLRRAGYPGAYPRGLSTAYQDVGAIQNRHFIALARVFTGM